MNSLFLEILNIQSSTYQTERMTEYLLDKCLELGYDVEYDQGNLYVTKGISPDGTYPCIVSHTDTVHDIIPDSDYMVVHDYNIAMAYDIKNMRPTGIGGDDKVGIYICMRMLDELDYCKAAFFRDEEVGCIGSGLADMSFFSDVRFVLQCDRKGNSDFVYNIYGQDLYSNEFARDVDQYLYEHGYSESTGMLTDVYQLALNGVGVSVANMSCGYYNPHCDDEMINLQDVDNCLSMVYKIMSNCTKTYNHKTSKVKSFGSTKYGYYDDWHDTWLKTSVNDNKWEGWTYENGKYSKSITDQLEECWHCGIDYFRDELNKDGLCTYCDSYHRTYEAKQYTKEVRNHIF